MAKVEEKKHNGNISFWKFVFAIFVLFHHITTWMHAKEKTILFNGGSIGVEFFFIVSGFLLAKKVFSEERKKDNRPLWKSTYEFMIKKIKGIYPYLVFSYVIFLLLAVTICDTSLLNLVKSLMDFMPIHQAGFQTTGMVEGLWYVSSMLLGMLLLYPLLKKYKKNFSRLVAPMIAIFLGGFLIHTLNASSTTLRNYSFWIGFMYAGLARGFFEMCIGITVYEIVDAHADWHFTKFGSILLLLVQWICFGVVIAANTVFKSGTRNFDWLAILLLAIGIAIGFSGKIWHFEKWNNRFFYFLEKLSLPLYLNNFIFIRIINNTNLHNVWSLPFAYFMCTFLTILLSTLEVYLMPIFLKIVQNIFTKFKRLCLEEEKL